MNPENYKLPKGYEGNPSQVSGLQIRMRNNAAFAAQELAKAHYSYPKNKEEWWATVEKFWDILIVVAQKYCDLNSSEDCSGNFSTNSLLSNITIAKNNRDSHLSWFFERVWMVAPDDGRIHGDPAFGVICDLCSESYVLAE